MSIDPATEPPPSEDPTSFSVDLEAFRALETQVNAGRLSGWAEAVASAKIGKEAEMALSPFLTQLGFYGIAGGDPTELIWQAIAEDRGSVEKLADLGEQIRVAQDAIAAEGPWVDPRPPADEEKASP